jgi:hypothetical protein
MATKGKGPIFEAVANLFDSVISKAPVYGDFATCHTFVAGDEEIAYVRELRGHVSPNDIIIARDYPGTKMISLNGESADESVGLMLAAELTTRESLYGFSALLAQPTIAGSIIAILLPRANYAVRRGQYLIDENEVERVTTSVLADLNETRRPVIAAFTHVMVMTLTHLGLVMPSQEKRLTRVSKALVLDMDDLAKVILIDSMRDMFNAQRLAGISKELDQDAVPSVIANVISRNLRNISQLVPEISLRIQQLELAENVVMTYLANPAALPEVIQAYSTLHTLANFANFIVKSRNPTIATRITEANSDIKEALDNVLTVINSASSIDVIPLSKLKDYYGFVPASTAGLYKGGVLYTTSGQQSKMSVYEALEERGSVTLRFQPLEYSPVSKVADEINRSLMNPNAVKGLANIIADEMSAAPFDIGDRPSLRTVGITDTELEMLALAMATSVSFNAPVNNAVATLIPVYGVTVAEQWLMHVSASAGAEVYFMSATTALLYAYGTLCANTDNSEIEAQGLPSKHQSLEIPVFVPIKFVGDMNHLLNAEIQEAFTVRLPATLSFAGKEGVNLDLVLSMLPVLLPPPDVDGKININPLSKVSYVTVREQGIDAYTSMLLLISRGSDLLR